MNVSEAVSIPIIASIVYAALTIYKGVIGDNEKYIKIIPIIAATLGAALGIMAYYLAPDIVLATNVLTALFLGAASGLAATGTNQIFKQLAEKPKENLEEETNEKDQNTSEKNNK